MEQLADRLEAAADMMATVDRSLLGLTVPAIAFGTDDAGLPGRIGRRVHAHWTAVLAARAREAADAAVHLADMADALRRTGRHYADTDETAGRRIERHAR
jgi:hypothetical protein